MYRCRGQVYQQKKPSNKSFLTKQFQDHFFVNLFSQVTNDDRARNVQDQSFTGEWPDLFE